MKVTAVIPIYNRQELGERSLRSVLAQTRPCDEIILVDDASPSPFMLPPDVIKNNSIKLLRHSVNQGEAGARNTGVSAASEDWIAFLDSDDVWLPEKLEKQCAFIQEFARSDRANMTVFSTGFIHSKEASGTTRTRWPIPSSSVDDFASACWFMPGSTAIFHKDGAAAAGLFDTRLRRSVDLDWYLRFALAGGQLAVSPVVGSIIEVGARPAPNLVEETCKLLEDKWSLKGHGGHLTSKQKRQLWAYLDVERASAAMHHHAPLNAFGYLLRSFVRVPRYRTHLRKWWSDMPPRNPKNKSA